ncbi:MAG: LPS export ABC transporter periplasmic protein LptC [Candidatus Electryonea clarkiae]|nr:LPS export ABC transporter periplasmic protein LptC [Candidatus Electryonea clarkiae]MDP8289037.1 LPS export ABC transporter periplasmic protein LptC [Candidatus Electryonea clarkiae]
MKSHQNILLSVFICQTAFFYGCTELDEKSLLADREVRKSLASEEFDIAQIIHTAEGETTFVLTAPKIYRYDNTSRAELKGGIHVDFYKSGRITSTLTADEGEVLRDGKELIGIGNVVVETDSGMTIYTEKLTWTERDHMVRSDTTTTLITEFDTLVGSSMVSTDDLKYKRLFDPIGISHRENQSSENDNETSTSTPSATYPVIPGSSDIPDEKESEPGDTTNAGIDK